MKKLILNGKVETSLLQFIVNWLWGQMSQSSSNYYLPDLIYNMDNHNYDPYTAGDWNVGQLPQSIKAACISGSSQGNPTDNPTLDLSVVSLAGLSNVLPHGNPPIVQSDSTFTALVDFGVVANWKTANMITISGQYSFAQDCLGTFGPLKDKNYQTNGYGNFTVQVFEAQGSLDISVTPDPSDPNNKLVVAVSNVILKVPAASTKANCQASGSSQNTNLCITIKSTSGEDVDFLAGQAANQSRVSQQMVSQVNTLLNAEGNLDSLNKTLTDAINNFQPFMEDLLNKSTDSL